MARLLVTGVTGQIGTYLAELLRAEGHEILGIGAPRSTKPLPEGAEAARGAWSPEGLAALGRDNGHLDAVVLLGARSSVAESWADPPGAFEANAQLTATFAYRLAKESPTTRLVHASSSNVFGRVTSPMQNEATPLAPVSPYGVSKAAAQLAVTNAREGLGAPMSNLIYFMGVSKRSSPALVLRKITRGVASVLSGRAMRITLGTMHVVRDICHARDFAAAAKLLALDGPAGDYVCASGRGRSIREMAELACRLSHLDPQAILEEDTTYARPNDILSLVGDVTRLRGLGWSPQTSFEELVMECLAHDRAEIG